MPSSGLCRRRPVLALAGALYSPPRERLPRLVGSLPLPRVDPEPLLGVRRGPSGPERARLEKIQEPPCGSRLPGSGEKAECV